MLGDVRSCAPWVILENPAVFMVKLHHWWSYDPVVVHACRGYKWEVKRSAASWNNSNQLYTNQLWTNVHKPKYSTLCEPKNYSWSCQRQFKTLISLEFPLRTPSQYEKLRSRRSYDRQLPQLQKYGHLTGHRKYKQPNSKSPFHSTLCRGIRPLDKSS